MRVNTVLGPSRATEAVLAAAGAGEIKYRGVFYLSCPGIRVELPEKDELDGPPLSPRGARQRRAGRSRPSLVARMKWVTRLQLGYENLLRNHVCNRVADVTTKKE